MWTLEATRPLAQVQHHPFCHGQSHCCVCVHSLLAVFLVFGVVFSVTVVKRHVYNMRHRCLRFLRLLDADETETTAVGIFQRYGGERALPVQIGPFPALILLDCLFDARAPPLIAKGNFVQHANAVNRRKRKRGHVGGSDCMKQPDILFSAGADDLREIDRAFANCRGQPRGL